MTGLALSLSDLPSVLIESAEITPRVYDRHGKPEVRFLWQHGRPILPVRWCGSVRLFPWGSQKRRGTALPYGGWVSEDRVRAGVFHSPEPVVIPATFGYEAGVWFGIDEGVTGVVVQDGTGPVVYMLMRPSSNYYRNMTRQTPMMPVLVGQVI
jgi:hypothetical protein